MKHIKYCNVKLDNSPFVKLGGFRQYWIIDFPQFLNEFNRFILLGFGSKHVYFTTRVASTFAIILFSGISWWKLHACHVICCSYSSSDIIVSSTLLKLSQGHWHKHSCFITFIKYSHNIFFFTECFSKIVKYKLHLKF